jgi:hypothetical protein
MSKKYPLEIENIGGDECVLISKGHHDIHDFMKQVRGDGYDWPLGIPAHCYMKTVPTKEEGFICRYEPVTKSTRGAWPCTIVQEDYGDRCYEFAYPTPPKECV